MTDAPHSGGGVVATALSRPREIHAAVYGLAVGYALATDAAIVRLGLLALLFLGDGAMDVAGQPARELRAERQYAVAGGLVGVALGRLTADSED